jgi:hypothetical protein
VRYLHSTLLVISSALTGSGLAHGAPAVATPAPSSTHCQSSEYRQFDFWIGDWDVYDTGNSATRVARVRVSAILGGCVLLEEYAGADGHQGRSFSLYDASSKSWHQTWVTNHGEMLAIEGSLESSGAMILNGTDRAPDGRARRVRGRWLPEAGGGVREIAARSLDDGATWTPWFDLEFRKHR